MMEIITVNERRQIPILMLLMFIGMLLETTSVSLIAPTFGLMSQSDIGTKYPQLEPFLKWLGNPNQAQLIIGGMLTLLSIFLIKSLFLILLSWRQNKFLSKLQASLSYRFYAGYLSQPWSFYLERNSAQLIFNSTTEVNILVELVLQPAMMLIMESLVLIGIASILFFVAPLGALVVTTVLCMSSVAFNRGIRGYLRQWANARQRHDGLRLQQLQQGINGAKEVKLLGREREFLKQYSLHNNGFASARQRQRTLMDIPRLWLELLAIAGLALLVLLMLAQHKPLDELVLTVTLFAAAAFRSMPSLVRVMGAIQNIRSGAPVIHKLYAESSIFNKQQALVSCKNVAFECEIKLEHIEFTYEQGARKALDNVNITVKYGQSIGIIGSSGAGKSTLVDIILGLLTLEKGVVTVDGADIQNNLRDWQDQLGYVPQTIYLTDDTLRRNVAFGLPDDLIDDKALAKAIEAAQLDDFVRSLPLGTETFVGERGVRLSGGQRQRIGIARALYSNPKVLILDEATSALDVKTEKDVMDAVNALHGNKTVIIIAHRFSTVAQCDRLYKLEHGKVIEQGTFEQVVSHSTASFSVV